MKIVSLLALAELGLSLSAVPALPAHASDAALQEALASPRRSEGFVKRDAARHPQQELEFFGLRPDMTVVEVWPGGGYWTEILAPYLKKAGTYYVAVPPPKDPEAAEEGKDKFRNKLAAEPAMYGGVKFAEFGLDHYAGAPAGSVDLIVTFRNLHNWMEHGYASQMLEGFFRALKPGGILGIEEHRARNDVAQDPKAQNGYVRQDYTIELAKKAGFELVGSSEINANPRDTKDWPKGVWTLPPTLALKDQDRDKYIAIGEADNYVLKFRKPKT
jgi:predicted methyltransferase